MPGVTPGIFVFLVFGTTAGCRAALRDLIVRRPRRKNSVETGAGSRKPWRREQVERQSVQPDLFAESTEAIARVDEDPAQPPPIATLVSKYNKTYNASHDAVVSLSPIAYSPPLSRMSRGSGPERYHSDGADTIQLRSLSSLEQVREDYYGANSEHSDDSGPILPIMNPQNKSLRSQIGLAVTLPGGRWAAGAERAEQR